MYSATTTSRSCSTQRVMSARVVGTLSVLVTLFMAWGPVQAQTPEPWLTDALELQEDIDRDAPLSQAMWIGTHFRQTWTANRTCYF